MQPVGAPATGARAGSCDRAAHDAGPGWEVATMPRGSGVAYLLALREGGRENSSAQLSRPMPDLQRSITTLPHTGTLPDERAML